LFDIAHEGLLIRWSGISGQKNSLKGIA